MTLNGVIALTGILLYFTEFDSFADLLHHSACRETYIVCRISSFTVGQNWPTMQHGLSALAELLVYKLSADNYVVPAALLPVTPHAVGPVTQALRPGCDLYISGIMVCTCSLYSRLCTTSRAAKPQRIVDRSCNYNTVSRKKETKGFQ